MQNLAHTSVEVQDDPETFEEAANGPNGSEWQEGVDQDPNYIKDK